MNIFDIPQGDMPQELVQVLLTNKNVRIERIVSKQHTTDWFDQDEEEWVVLLSGYSEIELENKIIILNAGDTMFIPKHQKHRVLKTTECIWLCIFIGEYKPQNEEVKTYL